MFFFNFLFWLLGLLLSGVGLYAVFDKWHSGESFKLDNAFDVLFNLALLLVIVGGIVFIVSKREKRLRAVSVRLRVLIQMFPH